VATTPLADPFPLKAFSEQKIGPVVGMQKCFSAAGLFLLPQPTHSASNFQSQTSYSTTIMMSDELKVDDSPCEGVV
jgi:hypothetical protein